MQNRYVGDIGDYVKLAILRQLCPGKRLGVAWWIFPDEKHNNDGRHRSYLNLEEWRQFDRELFDTLLRINRRKERGVRDLEDPALLPNAVFVRDPVPCTGLPFTERPIERRRWLLDIKTRFEDRDLIFLDPDNGIASEGLRRTRRCAGKSVWINELQELQARHRAIVVYQHQSRRKGGHMKELRDLANRLRDGGFRVCGALRAKRWSPRAFFLLDGDEELCTRAHNIEELWGDKIRWFPDL